MKKNLIFIPLILLLFFSANSVAQTHMLTGTVQAFEQFPVNHVFVKAMKSGNSTYTDELGHFSLEVKDNDVLKIKDPVFVPYSKKINESDTSLVINLYLHTDDQSMDKVIKMGYMTRQNLDYGVNHLWKNNNQFSQFTDAYDAIKYALPEATIIFENGHKAIEFRGTKSIEYSNAALIVVDGVAMNDVSFLPPSTIFRITKLPSTQAALYGSRAANGVVNIETK